MTTRRGTWTAPRWLAIDRALLEALDEYRAELCPQCGDPIAEHGTPGDYGHVPLYCPQTAARIEDEEADEKVTDKVQRRRLMATRRIYAKHGDAQRLADWIRGLRTKPTPQGSTDE